MTTQLAAKIQNPKSKIQNLLQLLGLLLLIVGFAGPWVYGPLGRSGQWGWQPVWGLLLSFIAVNLFGLVSLASCFSYVELYLRQGRPPLAALLKWIAGFFGLVVLTPLVVWLFLNQTERSPTSLQTDGTLGWGVWAALLGQILLVAALRLQIQEISKKRKEESKAVLK